MGFGGEHVHADYFASFDVAERCRVGQRCSQRRRGFFFGSGANGRSGKGLNSISMDNDEIRSPLIDIIRETYDRLS